MADFSFASSVVCSDGPFVGEDKESSIMFEEGI